MLSTRPNMSNLPASSAQNFAYWIIRATVDGKKYKQKMADVVYRQNSHKIFEALKKLGAAKCSISYHVAATEADFDALFPPVYEQ